MQKVIIKDLSLNQIAMAEMEDPSAWITECTAANVWGLSERPELDVEGNPTGVMLPAEYTVEIIDISAEYALAEVIKNRVAEYPSPAEFMNAFFDGGESAIAELQTKRLAIKAKYPKPV
jgi:hypothetical protein